jgi:hypothetical protein
MAEITLTLGADVQCTDQPCGQVRVLVVDGRAVSHLVVEPAGRAGLGRLVPLSLLEASAADGLRLSCTEAEFQQLEAAEETLTQYVPGHDAPVQLLPPGWRGGGGPAVSGEGIERAPGFERTDRVPGLVPGANEEHRGDHVHASDGDIGRLQGLTVDATSHEVTGVLLREGLDRHVTIPAAAVDTFDDGIHLSISRHEVREAARHQPG